MIIVQCQSPLRQPTECGYAITEPDYVHPPGDAYSDEKEFKRREREREGNGERQRVKKEKKIRNTRTKENKIKGNLKKKGRKKKNQ